MLGSFWPPRSNVSKGVISELLEQTHEDTDDSVTLYQALSRLWGCFCEQTLCLCTQGAGILVRVCEGGGEAGKCIICQCSENKIQQIRGRRKDKGWSVQMVPKGCYDKAFVQREVVRAYHEDMCQRTIPGRGSGKAKGPQWVWRGTKR